MSRHSSRQTFFTVFCTYDDYPIKIKFSQKHLTHKFSLKPSYKFYKLYLLLNINLFLHITTIKLIVHFCSLKLKLGKYIQK